LKKIETRLFFQSDNTLSCDLDATQPENLKLILEQFLINQIGVRKTLEIDKLFKARDLLDRTTKEIYLSILELEGQAPQEKQLKRLLLLQDFFSKTLTSYIEKKSEATGYKSSIDKAVIDAATAS
jgi:hypothetical protein